MLVRRGRFAPPRTSGGTMTTDHNPTIHVDQGVDKETIKTRLDCLGSVRRAILQSELYKSDTHVKATGDDILQAGDELKAADDRVHADEDALSTSIRVRRSAVKKFDKKHASYCTSIE